MRPSKGGAASELEWCGAQTYPRPNALCQTKDIFVVTSPGQLAAVAEKPQEYSTLGCGVAHLVGQAAGAKVILRRSDARALRRLKVGLARCLQGGTSGGEGLRGPNGDGASVPSARSLSQLPSFRCVCTRNLSARSLLIWDRRRQPPVPCAPRAGCHHRGTRPRDADGGP